MAIKLATFFVDAVSSKILGAFEVRNSADTTTNLSVDNATGATNVSGGGDVSLVAGSGRLQIGNKAGEHIAIDENEIMAKSNGTTAATLYLNNDGGLVTVGAGGLEVAGTLNASGLIRVFSAAAAVFGENIEYPVYMGRSQAFLGVNAYFDGTAWQRKDTSLPSSCFCLNPVSGGIEVRYAAAGSGAISWTVSKVWNAANDGSGSGLDADLLDGQHGSYYAPLNSPALTGEATAPTRTHTDSSSRIATTAFVKSVTERMANHFLVKENNPGTNQTIYIVPTDISNYGIILFKGIIYDVDDPGEYARFMSPQYKPMLILAEYKRTYTDSSGSIGYSDISKLSCATSRVVGPGTELARVTYGGIGDDSVEYQCIAMLLP
jgi:hypothetical protein